jgi:hypothetical protein
MIKRSQRCRKCEHNLSKPEYNPTSIKFKIQLAAYYHIPEVIIYKLAPASSCFLPGSECNFVLKLSNPTQHPTNIEFLDLNEFFKTKVAKEEAEAVAKETSKDSNEKPVRQHSVAIEKLDNLQVKALFLKGVTFDLQILHNFEFCSARASWAKFKNVQKLHKSNVTP